MSVTVPDFTQAGHEHGQPAVDGLIRELELEPVFGFAPGTSFAARNP